MPPPMSDLRGLIERVEKATGPDRELDALINAVVVEDRELVKRGLMYQTHQALGGRE